MVSPASMLGSKTEVIRCLMTYTDWYQPASSSVIQVGFLKRERGGRDGLHPGVVETLDERRELRRRVALLPTRDRAVLFLWYVKQLAVSQIARELGVSSRQCHRLRGRAVQRIVDLGETEAVA